MRSTLFALTAASAIASAAALLPASAGAMTVGTAPGMHAAIADASLIAEVACRHRSLTSRRVCWSKRGHSRHWHHRHSRSRRAR